MEFKNICIVCNSNFISKSFNRKTCSDKCKREHTNKYQLELSKKYYENNKEKISKKNAEKWLRKTNKKELTEKGKKIRITREENKKIKNLSANLSIDLLLQEFGNVE